MFRTGRRAEMSANPVARDPRHRGDCASRSPKPDEGSREETDEASDEVSGDAP